MFSFFKKKEKPRYFLALLLRDEKATAVIFEEIAGKAKIEGFQEEYFSKSIEEVDSEEFLEVLDRTISSAESNLSQNIEINKTLFGVKENWVSDSKIKKEYLARLKKTSESLGLEPIGFLVIQEAIAHLLQQEEGVPLSAILMEIDKKNIALSIFRAGRIIETRRSFIKDSLAQTCDKLLHQFTENEILPAKIIIFDGKNGDKVQQEFISHSWSKDLPFLHVPQIAVLAPNFDAKAVLFGAASQMGFEILEDKEEKRLLEEESNILENKEAKKEIQENNTETKDLKEEIFESESIGFGFLENEDVLIIKNTADLKINHKDLKEEKNEKVFQENTGESEKIEKNQKKLIVFSIIKKLVKKIKIPEFSIKIPKKIIFLPLLIILLFLGLLLSYLLKVNATISITLNPKIIEQTKDIVFSTKTQDLLTNQIPGKTISIIEEGELSSDVTGKKETGTKAKGTITIYSRLPQNKSFDEGTLINGPNNLLFTLNKTITIASSSADASSPATTITVNITAKDIGKEFNLPSGAKFNISSFDASNLIGKNDSAFLGGTKKEVTAVSKADLDKLVANLPKSLEKEVKNNLQKKLGEKEVLLPIFTGITFDKKEFDQKIGNEASKITLKAAVSFETIAYKEDRLADFLKKTLKNSLSDDLNLKDIKYDFSDLKFKEDTVSGKINIKASLFPLIDKKKLIENLKGKTFESAEKELFNLSQVENVSISLNPNFSFLPKIIPRIGSNIEIIIETK